MNNYCCDGFIAMTFNLSNLQALHEMYNVHQKSSSTRNWWLSLLPELTVLNSEPVKTKVSEVGGGKLRFTIWDQVNNSVNLKNLFCGPLS